MSADANPDALAEKLAQQLQKQTVVCENIRTLSQRQQALVADHKEDELLALLADKQALIDQHQKLFETTLALRDKWETLKSGATPQAQGKAEQAWEKLKAVLNEVVALEDASRGVLEEQKSKVGMDISKIQRGKIANKAYGGSMRPLPKPGIATNAAEPR